MVPYTLTEITLVNPLFLRDSWGFTKVLKDGRDTSLKKAQVGDRIFMVGGAIGKDGLHGATFSSLELNEKSPTSAVQIGDPLTQKRVTDFSFLKARDLGLYSSLTDNGAGGLSSSVGEMAEFTGGATLDYLNALLNTKDLRLGNS